MLTLELPKLYDPVAPDFQRYEEAFQDAIRTGDPGLHELVQHVCRFRGKQLRPALVFLAARSSSGEVPDSCIQAAVAIELIHTATLVHDDVIDEADKRRSMDTVNSRWGNETSVLLGDFLFATAYGVAASSDSLHCPRYLAMRTQRVCRGEVEQLHNRGNKNLDRETYMSIIADKTATLYAAAAELGSRYAGGDESTVAAFEQYGRNLGIAFQIADDILDLLGEEEFTGKSLGTDLEKGTMTLPILHALENADGALHEKIASLLSDGYRGSRSELRDLIEPLGSFEHARQVGRDLISEGLAAISSLPSSPALESLQGIGEYVMERKL